MKEGRKRKMGGKGGTWICHSVGLPARRSVERASG